MDPLLFASLILVGSFAAGLLGSLTGLGGGAILTPILVLLLGVDIKYAIGASLVAVIATSSGAAAAYVRDGFTNLRLAMLLEVATVFGAIGGALVAARVSTPLIATVFGLVLLWTAWNARHAPAPSKQDTSPPDPLATRFQLDSDYPTPTGIVTYRVRNVIASFLVMVGAGVLSALVGIGSGVFKVLAMDKLMRLPLKVSTTTSNFMIGVTAAASAVVYLHRGQIEATTAGPVALGALGGSMLGARLLPRINTRILRIIFACVVALAGAQMIYKGVTSLHAPATQNPASHAEPSP